MKTHLNLLKESCRDIASTSLATNYIPPRNYIAFLMVIGLKQITNPIKKNLLCQTLSEMRRRGTLYHIFLLRDLPGRLPTCGHLGAATTSSSRLAGLSTTVSVNLNHG
jgi:hypothetical protein